MKDAENYKYIITAITHNEILEQTVINLQDSNMEYEESSDDNDNKQLAVPEE
jgi:hypothetical protein